MSDETEVKDIDKVFEEWDKRKEDAKTDSANKELLAKIEEQGKQIQELIKEKEVNAKHREETSYQQDIKPAITTLKGDLAVSDEWAEWFLLNEGSKNKELQELWDNRHEKAKEFQNAIEELAPKFQDLMKKEAKTVLDIKEDPPKESDDVDQENEQLDGDALQRAFTAAVLSSRDAKPSDNLDNTKWGELSQHDFEVQKHRLFDAVRKGKYNPKK